MAQNFLSQNTCVPRSQKENGETIRIATTSLSVRSRQRELLRPQTSSYQEQQAYHYFGAHTIEMSSTLGEAARVIGEAEKDLFNNYNPLEPQPEETLAQYMTRDRADRKNHLLCSYSPLCSTMYIANTSPATLKWVLFYEKYRDGWINAKKQSVRKLRNTLKRQIEATNMVMRSEAQDEEIRVASEGHIKNQKEAKKLAEKLFQKAAAERRAAERNCVA